MTAHNARSAKAAYQQAQRRAMRAITRSNRKAPDIASRGSSGVAYFNCVFQGWETADANLMMATAPNGELMRYIPTYYHVKNTGTWTTGVTIVRLVHYGNGTWCDGQPIGDPTVATQ